jgi:hypothetical protein
MSQRRHHYERAFEEYLRSRRIPYVSVDEARKALLPDAASLRLRTPSGDGRETPAALKSFDFVVYGDGANLLLDVKGRRVVPRRSKSPTPGVSPRSRLESWVTEDDIESLTQWERLFGESFQAAFLFVYWCDEQPPDALFQEIFEYRGRWYALRAVTVREYAAVMKPRSARWRTVDVPTAVFEQVSQPFAPPPVAPALRRDDPLGRTVYAIHDGEPVEDPGPSLPALTPYENRATSGPARTGVRRGGSTGPGGDRRQQSVDPPRTTHTRHP